MHNKIGHTQVDENMGCRWDSRSIVPIKVYPNTAFGGEYTFPLLTAITHYLDQCTGCSKLVIKTGFLCTQRTSSLRTKTVSGKPEVEPVPCAPETETVPCAPEPEIVPSKPETEPISTGNGTCSMQTGNRTNSHLKRNLFHANRKWNLMEQVFPVNRKLV